MSKTTSYTLTLTTNTPVTLVVVTTTATSQPSVVPSPSPPPAESPEKSLPEIAPSALYGRPTARPPDLQEVPISTTGKNLRFRWLFLGEWHAKSYHQFGRCISHP